MIDYNVIHIQVGSGFKYMWFITIFITHIYIFVFNLTHAAKECLKHETIYYKDVFTHKDIKVHI